jgi:phosphatidylserine/phosphatidylglycerophosphate/cardiolipin synthase-like enzyme
MQVAQTSFRPKPGSGTSGFDWAREGNSTIHDTIVRSIQSAQEYIYIEEQYMVPDHEYIQALTDAADHCKRLIIVLPTFLEIFFGDIRRAQMFQAMAGTTMIPKWGDRMLIGTPMRRPVLAAADRVTSVGRCTLLADIGASDSTIFLGPPTRVPKGRFFFWIGGELMFATASTLVTGPGGKPAKQLDVLRGGLGTSQRWCPDPRPHKAGEPATLSQPTGIFVHSKIMMVDDLFVSIGSSNVNRRGYFHDGEVQAFAIPQDLRGAADNPARDLRTRLWAEQLGLAPDMGAALLSDPIAGFEFFRRSRYQGNRFTPLTELALPTPTLNDMPALLDVLPEWVKQILQLGLQVTLEAFSKDIFNTLSDPTTGIDPNPTPGPDLP